MGIVTFRNGSGCHRPRDRRALGREGVHVVGVVGVVVEVALVAALVASVAGVTCL